MDSPLRARVDKQVSAKRPSVHILESRLRDPDGYALLGAPDAAQPCDQHEVPFGCAARSPGFLNVEQRLCGCIAEPCAGKRKNIRAPDRLADRAAYLPVTSDEPARHAEYEERSQPALFSFCTLKLRSVV